MKEATWRSNERWRGERVAVTGLELVQESGGAVINLHGSYRVALGVGGLRPSGASRGALHVN